MHIGDFMPIMQQSYVPLRGMEEGALAQRGINTFLTNSNSAKGVSLSSPSLGLIARDVRLGYALLCDNWDKRKADAERLRADAQKIEDEGVLRGFARGEDGGAKSISGLASSLWLFSPLDFD